MKKVKKKPVMIKIWISIFTINCTKNACLLSAQIINTADSSMKQEDKVYNFKKKFMANLEKNITCSKCKKVPRDATVSWCSAHHLICQSCYDTNKKQTFRLENLFCRNQGQV
jgi:hypothetical protein